MLKKRNAITLYVITILYVVRAKIPSGMLPVGIEPTDPLSYTTPSCAAS